MTAPQTLDRGVEVPDLAISVEAADLDAQGPAADLVRVYLNGIGKTALLTADPEYRAYFARVWVDIMNHRLTPAFLRERYDHYAELAVELGVPDLEYLKPLKEFLEVRPAVVRAHAERWLQTGPSVRVRYIGRGAPIEIDGHYGRTLGCKQERGLAADSPGGACDQGHFVLQSHQMRSKYRHRSQSVTQLSKASCS